MYPKEQRGLLNGVKRECNSGEVFMRLSPTESEGSAVSEQGIGRRVGTDIEKMKTLPRKELKVSYGE